MHNSELDEIVGEFIVESHENLDQLDQELVALERSSDPGVIDRIFRAIHTIKGTAGSLGFSSLEAVTHAGENLLSKLRAGDLVATSAVTDALLAMVDVVREILASVGATGQEPGASYPEVVGLLQRLAEDEVDLPIGERLLRRGLITEAQLADALRAQDSGDPRHIGELLVERAEVPASEVVQALKAQADERKHASESIRVDLRVLDELVNLVGELVLARNQILQFTSDRPDRAFGAAVQRLDLITSELQDGVMRIRMQPIEQVWNRFRRVVRDLGAACGKQVRLEMEGSHTELDKTLLEAIKDPLTHLVRNALDHGLEAPDRRVAIGKPPEGVVRLRAFHDGGHVVVEISDDGAGIDPNALRRTAVQKGLMSAEEAAGRSDHEIVSVIFLPGFSTAETLSNISGRGVGMDVVRTNIEGIGGSIDVRSTLGAGSTFTLRIPRRESLGAGRSS